LSDLSGNAGISAIMNAKEKEQKDAEQTLGSAFKDLDALMILAKDLVSLADSFSKKVAESEEHSEDEQKINSVMMSLGIISSISKESSETAYINQLARQLADFLLPIVQKEGGLIQITDAYCLFNRAKGTDLISPEDLLRACREMKRLQLPLLLRKLTSGSMVLQAASHSDGKLSKIVLEILKNQGPMTALQLSKAMQVSLVLAKQYLFVAEQLGILCRDETVDSLRFYENLII
jgi:ESCRT-II complex subunit VPS36